MGIVFDEVVGTVSPAPRATTESPAPPSHGGLPGSPPDPDRLRRELQALKRREARLFAD